MDVGTREVDRRANDRTVERCMVKGIECRAKERDGTGGRWRKASSTRFLVRVVDLQRRTSDIHL